MYSFLSFPNQHSTDQCFSSSLLTFSWNPVAPNSYYAALHYNILKQNCGRCPSTTQRNRVVCHDMDVGRNLTYSFVAQNFRTCDGVAGNMSIPVNFPHYSYSTKEFVGLTVQFNQLVSRTNNTTTMLVLLLNTT